jgi:hypothetical protein
MKNFKNLVLLASSLFIYSCASNERASEFNNEETKDYKLEKIVYQIENDESRDLLQSQQEKTKFKKGQVLNKSTFIKERKRITTLIRKHLNPSFSEKNIRFEIDTTLANNKFSVLAIVEN